MINDLERRSTILVEGQPQTILPGLDHFFGGRFRRVNRAAGGRRGRGSPRRDSGRPGGAPDDRATASCAALGRPDRSGSAGQPGRVPTNREGAGARRAALGQAGSASSCGSAGTAGGRERAPKGGKACFDRSGVSGCSSPGPRRWSKHAL